MAMAQSSRSAKSKELQLVSENRTRKYMKPYLAWPLIQGSSVRTGDWLAGVQESWDYGDGWVLPEPP